MPGTGSLRELQRTPSASMPLADVVEFGFRCNLECQSRTARVLAIFELNHQVAMLGREVGSPVFPLRQRQTGNFREIGDLAFQVGRLESDVAEALGHYHGALRIADRSVARSRRRLTVCLVRDRDL